MWIAKGVMLTKTKPHLVSYLGQRLNFSAGPRVITKAVTLCSIKQAPYCLTSMICREPVLCVSCP